MIALVDSGTGNLRSVKKALETVGAEVNLTNNSEEILAAEKVALPGVGAFGDSMKGLLERGLVDVINDVVLRGTTLLGICVGMQLLFDSSEELGFYQGLGFVPGRVKRFDTPGLKVPQTGWNQLKLIRNCPLFRGLPDESYAYFNHSYYCEVDDMNDMVTETEYGIGFASAIQRDNVYGVQFHPEKSQKVGLTILKNFLELC
ncbi:MAG: imidazole glycerol phosphate synthase subunit HisH [Anaerolineae bacterium SG8_19]|jgi:glutamine amidotransferase|nr:MAG: imidazole glycerol phosphate synthase subunit HisH [Anaerolineae bacterium SG8_19]